MNKSRKRSEAEVAEYWLTHDSAAEVDWAAPGVRLAFDPEVERPTQPVTVRRPRRLLQELSVLAKDRDVPYQVGWNRGLQQPLRHERLSIDR